MGKGITETTMFTAKLDVALLKESARELRAAGYPEKQARGILEDLVKRGVEVAIAASYGIGEKTEVLIDRGPAPTAGPARGSKSRSPRRAPAPRRA